MVQWHKNILFILTIIHAIFLRFTSCVEIPVKTPIQIFERAILGFTLSVLFGGVNNVLQIIIIKEKISMYGSNL